MKPAQQTRQQHEANGFTEIIHRGRGAIVSRKPGEPDKRALTSQTGGRWHFGNAPFSQSQEVDTAWQVTAGAWDYEMTLNDFQTFARDTFNVGNIFQFVKGGKTVTLDPQSINWIDENRSRQQIAIKQNVAATVDDDKLIFTNAYGTDIDFQYHNQTVRLQKLITIHNAAAIDTTLPVGNTIWFEAEFTISSAGVDIYLDGVFWGGVSGNPPGGARQTTSRIEFRDPADGVTVLWYFDYARAWDSAGSETIGEMEVRRDGAPSNLFVTVRIPKTWIDTAVFPIFIDPTLDDSVGASDEDGHERQNDTSFDTTSASIVCNSHTNAASAFVGLTFHDMPSGPAQGETIDVCYVTIFPVSTATDDVDVNFFFNDVDSANDLTAEADIHTRAQTTATVQWSTTGLGAAAVNSPSLVALLQEVVDRGSYASGNPVAVIYRGRTDINGNDLQFDSWDGDSGSAAAIHVEWTAGGATVVQDIIGGGIIPFAR